MELYSCNGSYAIAIPRELRYTVLVRPPIRFYSDSSNGLTLLTFTHNIHIVQLIPHPAYALRLLNIVIYSQLQWNWKSIIDKLAAQGKQVIKDMSLGYYAEARLRAFPKLAEDI
jgi:hypothetical protein